MWQKEEIIAFSKIRGSLCHLKFSIRWEHLVMTNDYVEPSWSSRELKQKLISIFFLSKLSVGISLTKPSSLDCFRSNWHQGLFWTLNECVTRSTALIDIFWPFHSPNTRFAECLRECHLWTALNLLRFVLFHSQRTPYPGRLFFCDWRFARRGFLRSITDSQSINVIAPMLLASTIWKSIYQI